MSQVRGSHKALSRLVMEPRQALPCAAILGSVNCLKAVRCHGALLPCAGAGLAEGAVAADGGAAASGNLVQQVWAPSPSEGLLSLWILRLPQVRGSQKGASRLVMELRPLPSREALALRAQAAAKAATAQAQAQGLERTLWRLAKKGVY